MATYCTRCSAKFDEGDRFCAQCGAGRPGAADTQDDLPVSRPEATAAKPRPPKSSFGPATSLGIGLIGPLAIGGLIFAISSGFSESVEGHVVVSEGPRAPFTFRPSGCASMQPYGRCGANLHAAGSDDGAVYVTLDPIAGKRVEIEIPGSCRDADGTDCTVFPVPRDHCTVFEAAVQNTGTVVNDVRLVEGHLRLDCTLEDGTRVVGNLTFDGC